MFRNLVLVACALFGTAASQSLQKVKTLSVCTQPFTPNQSGASTSAGVPLFTCNGNVASNTQVGRLSYICGTSSTANGQNGNIVCTDFITIGQCVISRTGEYGPNNNVLPAGVFEVSNPNKQCWIKSSYITSMDFVATPAAGFPAAERYTFNFNHMVKINM